MYHLKPLSLQDRRLCEVVGDHGAREWKKIAQLMERQSVVEGDADANFTDVQCLHRWNKVWGEDGGPRTRARTRGRAAIH